MAFKKMNMIVAVDSNFGIAKNNNMAWHLPKEYAHFVNLTSQTTDPNKKNAVIMGRKWYILLIFTRRDLDFEYFIILPTLSPIHTVLFQKNENKKLNSH